jgi:hypothetical protein
MVTTPARRVPPGFGTVGAGGVPRAGIIRGNHFGEGRFEQSEPFIQQLLGVEREFARSALLTGSEPVSSALNVAATSSGRASAIRLGDADRARNARPADPAVPVYVAGKILLVTALA